MTISTDALGPAMDDVGDTAMSRFRLLRPVIENATEAALENSIEAMRIHGAYGYSKEFNVERLYRDAPLLCIGEGTNEMQRIIIAKNLIARNPV